MHWLLLALLMLATPGAAAGEIYRTVDEHGNVIFTDRPPSRANEEAETVKVQPPNTFPSEEAAVSAGSLPALGNVNADVEYRLAISSPANDETVRSNNGNVDIVTIVRPSLGSDHQLMLLLDGQALDIEPDGDTWHLYNLDRGTHTLVLEVVDPDRSQPVSRSAPSVFHLHRATARRPTAP